MKPIGSYIQKIDALRGIAILGVFLFHTQLELFQGEIIYDYIGGRLAITDVKSAILNFSPVAFGWTGVQLFLLISGFLIHRGYLSKPESFTIRTFFIKRFWRIYPPYLLALLFMCATKDGICFYVTTRPGIRDLVTHLFMIQNLYEPAVFGINPSFWSLALEIQLYAVYPIVLIIRKRLGMKLTFFVLLILSISSAVAGELAVVPASVKFILINSIPSYWAVWTAGAFLAETYIKWNYSNRLIILMNIFLSTIALLAARYFEIASLLSMQLSALFWISVMVWFLNTQVKIKPVIMRGLTFTGLISYSLYLIHQPFLFRILLSFRGIPVSTFTPIAVLFTLIFLLAISSVLYRFVELPSIKLGNSQR